MVWSLWRMPTEAAKSQICEHVQTTAWTATKGTLNISRENALLTQKAAVSSAFNAVTAVAVTVIDVIGKVLGGCDGCTACRLQCSISQSVSAANISKLRERYGSPRNLHGFLTCFIREVQDMRAHPAQLSTRIRAQAIYTGSPMIRNSYGSFTFIFQCPLSTAHVI